ncbi:MAG TPA: T9SS type A sorting domain-containing protein [Bacteroidia bacterium]|nr:T9SS type A sorting domain-containing protein [Bacteroidia bacterium]
MKNFLLVTLLSIPLFANSQTWATDVAPILYDNCTKCHNPTGIAPFSLLTYNDAANEATDIKNSVTTGTMPPWPPDTAYTRFMHERVLTPTEIQTISDWVDNGIQPGTLSQAPAPPVYTGVAEIQNPDLSVQIPTFTVNAAWDLYRCFVIPSGLTSDTYITKVEVLPGNRSIVHHVLIFQDVQNTCVALDNADPGPGYTWTGGGIGSNTATGIAGWVPGQGVYELPPNFGIRIFTGSNIIVQVHYPGGTFGQIDSTQVRFTFSSGVTREVTLQPVINHGSSLVNGPLFIPANTTQTFYAQETASLNASLITVAPHMHLIGQQISSFAIDPLGDTIPLISIPDWSFHWQGSYHYRQPVHVPFGSVIYAEAFYDNTPNNPDNPNDPPEDVSEGESTTDEMFIIYFAYVSYLPGDENIIIDSSILSSQLEIYPSVVKTPQLYDPFPVPAMGNDLTISYFLPAAGETTLELVDANGKVVRVIQNSRAGAGFNTAAMSTQDLAAGTYVLRLTSGGVSKTKTIVL